MIDATAAGRYVIRATTPYASGDNLPTVRYWTDQGWGDYEHAEIYPTDNLGHPAPPRERSTTTVVPAHGVDLDGYPYTIADTLGAVRMTHCCGAATSVDERGFYCKSCYEVTDGEHDAPARVAPEMLTDDARFATLRTQAFGKRCAITREDGAYLLRDSRDLTLFGTFTDLDALEAAIARQPCGWL